MWFSSVELKILNRTVGYPLVNEEFGEYPLVNIQKTMENHNFYGFFSTISMAISNNSIVNCTNNSWEVHMDPLHGDNGLH